MDTIQPKKSLVEETYDILVDAICLQELKPGERLNQDEIAAKLNISRQPVNSAIAILKADDLVKDTGRRGVVVSPIDPDLARSIYEYRMMVEPFSIELAIDKLPDDARIAADEVLRRGRIAVKNFDVRGLLSADKDFHTLIYFWGNNRVVQKSMQVTWHHIRRTMAQVLIDPERAGPVWDEHALIFDSLFEGNKEIAARRMREHLQNGYARNFGEKSLRAEIS